MYQFATKINEDPRTSRGPEPPFRNNPCIHDNGISNSILDGTGDFNQARLRKVDLGKYFQHPIRFRGVMEEMEEEDWRAWVRRRPNEESLYMGLTSLVDVP